ncbi:MAG: ketoacyl-ACP synthase III [Neomegalonema sp.]|nr:ketoacyl-ACP synthase III [Neomegalonema sp.]
MGVRRSVMLGCGGYLPDRIVTNAELAKQVETSDEWIIERTGIRERRVAAEGEKTSDLAIAASERALAKAGIGADALDMIIVATSTPDNTFPATATRVQAELGALKAWAFDQQAVCSGFVYALATADAYLRSGMAETALVIGAETFSRILDWEDRGTCVLFGDGAGAVVLRAEDGAGATSDRGILATDLNTDGRYADLLYVDGGPSSTQTVGKLRMHGREVFRHAIVNLAETAEKVIERAGVDASDVDWIVPHQANIRIIAGTAKKLGVPMDRVVVTVDRHGNTSAASIPLALVDAVESGRIKPGELLLMEAMGGGMTWGAALVRW